jgi:hypothetical protein
MLLLLCFEVKDERLFVSAWGLAGSSLAILHGTDETCSTGSFVPVKGYRDVFNGKYWIAFGDRKHPFALGAFH